MAEAHLAYSPLVALAGMIPSEHLGRDTFQEIDQQALFQPICKRSIVVPRADRLPELLGDALRVAMSGRRGPVVLHVPRDMMAAEITSTPRPAPVPPSAGAPDASDLARILDYLKGAKAPVIVAGGGLKWARGSQALTQLAERLQVPVVAATGHADVMANDHPLYAGQAGPRGNTVASALTREADLLIVLGSRLGFNSTFHSHDYISASATIVPGRYRGLGDRPLLPGRPGRGL